MACSKEKSPCAVPSSIDLLDTIEYAINRAEQLSSLCLVINNALEGGSTSEKLYFPAFELFGEMLEGYHTELVQRLAQLENGGIT